ncbi:MAG: sulfatase [Pirellulaceae bacterium]|nr:sulfatase [Pirellulaceae bacterium]
MATAMVKQGGHVGGGTLISEAYHPLEAKVIEMNLKNLIPICIGYFLSMGGVCLQAQETPPNILLIFTDDQGYQDLGCFGSPDIQTPHLDQLADEGRKFTSFYSACSVCSPSRAALLTGCYPPRVGLTKVLFAQDSKGLNPEEVTLAEMLKQVGYRTACIGKWHLGHKAPFLPIEQGFDYYFGIPYSNDMRIDPTAKLADDIVLREGVTREQIKKVPVSKQKDRLVPLMRNDEVVEYPADQTSLTRRYTEEAIRFMEENKDQPFFVYLPHTMPHIPLFASEEYRGKSAAGLYGDTIEEIDGSVGQLTDALNRLGLAKQTLVIYTSDNGPWKLKNGHGGRAHPLRGFKFNTYEGGMRVPCIMRWPGKIPAGSVTDAVAGTIDLAPTIAVLCGATLPQDRVLDGHDIMPLMTGESAKSPHQAYFYYKGNRVSAVRAGDWKLRTTPADPKKQTPELVELFNLQDDISESKNLASEHPEKIAELREMVRLFDGKLKNASRPIGELRK